MKNQYPSKHSRTKGLKFVPGKIYVSSKYYGGKAYWYCESRSDNGFIYFRAYDPDLKTYSKGKIRRKPIKGWEHADERVEIIKGHTTSIWGCHTGGSMLYARDLYKDKKTHKVPSPFGL